MFTPNGFNYNIVQRETANQYFNLNFNFRHQVQLSLPTIFLEVILMNCVYNQNQRQSRSKSFIQEERRFGNEITNIGHRQVPFANCQKLQPKVRNVNSRIEEETTQEDVVLQYMPDIISYLKNIELTYCPLYQYMNSQPDITAAMRSILIDWLIDVHFKFKLVHETLFLAINLIDRYLSKTIVMRNKLQLVGIASLFIASKFEEIYAPELKDFVYVCDKAYTKSEVLEMESKILISIDFNLNQCSTLRFVERLCCGLTERVSNVAKMITELALMDVKYLKYRPSLQATTAVLLALNLLESPQVLAQSLYLIDVQSSQNELKECLQEMLGVLGYLRKENLSAIRRKYSQARFEGVAELMAQK